MDADAKIRISFLHNDEYPYGTQDCKLLFYNTSSISFLSSRARYFICNDDGELLLVSRFQGGTLEKVTVKNASGGESFTIESGRR